MRIVKKNSLHKITIKLLAVVQYTAVEEKNIKDWFIDYWQTLKVLQIKNKKNVINFDEVSFKVSCMKEHQIIVSLNVPEVCTHMFKLLK